MSQESWKPSPDVEETVLKHAVLNALRHGGKALLGPVISKVLGEKPELRPYVKELAKYIAKVINEVNSMSINDLQRLAKERFPEILKEKKPRIEKKVLPPLPNADKYKKVITRFAPNPDFAIHIGNARPALLCYEYARMYNGLMILRFEDTDPRIKVPLPEAYGCIKEDLRWLGVKWDEEYIQSLRIETYYNIAKELIKRNGAYVDLCKASEFRKYRNAGKPCPHRNEDKEVHLDRFEKMLRGDYGEGEAVLRIKTDLKYPDPSIRDWVAFRIIDTEKNPHPLVGSKYIVWPTYNFAAAVDDYLMGVTHILRAREHMVNTIKQKFLYSHMGWKYPEAIHFGRVRLEGFILSKSKIKELMKRYPGLFRGVDDIRFGTIAGLRQRGILPETIREIILELGIKPTDATISWENLAAINRKNLDPRARRIMFVANPVMLKVLGLNISEIKVLYHPSNKDLGERIIKVSNIVWISSLDLEILKKHRIVRLMELVNIELEGLEDNAYIAKVHSRDVETAKRLKIPIIQWVSDIDKVKAVIEVPSGLRIKRIKGYVESSITKLQLNEIVQLVRFGFSKINSIKPQIAKLTYIHD